MTEVDDLTRAFVAAHPVEAARELERLDAADAAALFARAPARLSAPVLAAMLPAAAARCLAPLADDRAALLVGALGAPAAAGIVRHLEAARRRSLLDALPTAAALACRALLRYPADSVGAVADASVVALPAGATAADALDAVRRGERAAETDVYVVGDDQRLLGVVGMAAALRAPAAASLRSLLRPVATLPALMPLGAAAGHPGWREAVALPVQEHGGRFLGALSAAALRRALAAAPPSAAAGAEPSLAGLLGAGYWSAVSSLAEAIVALLPTSRRAGQ